MKKENQNIEFKESWRDENLKWLCGFANSQGGKLYVGVDDRGRIVGVDNAKRLMEDIPNKIVSVLGVVPQVNLLESKGKEYLEIVVNPSSMPIAYHGAYHVRSGSTKQELKGLALQDFLLRKMGLSWDDVAQPRATIKDIDPEAVEYFQRVSIINKRMPRESFTDDIRKVLGNLRLIDEDGYLKNAALLAFGKNPAKFFPACDFRIGRFVGSDTNLIFQDVVSGNLIQMTDRVMELLRAKYLVSPIHYEGLRRVEPLEIPEAALREAIFNAIVHKDYAGVHIQMKVFNDRVELWNNGILPCGWTVDNLLQSHSSFPRNRNLAEVFYRAGFIESWGRGIDKIVEQVKQAGLVAPEFADFCGGLRVTFFRPFAVNGMDESAEKVAEKVAEKIGGKDPLPKEDVLAESPIKTHENDYVMGGAAVGESAEKVAEKSAEKVAEKSGGKNRADKVARYDRMVLAALADHPMQNSELCQVLGLGLSRTRQIVKSLTERSLVVAEGGGRGRIYRLGIDVIGGRQ